jgi:transposase-like protein
VATLSRSLDAQWLSYVAKTQQSMVAAALRQAFIQPDRAQASQTLRHVADQLRQQWPKLAAFIDDSETDVLSHLDFPEQHRAKLHSTNPLERLNKMGYPGQRAPGGFLATIA